MTKFSFKSTRFFTKTFQSLSCFQNMIQYLAQWQKKYITSISFAVEWLPLSVFDSNSQFVMSFDETTCMDASMSGGSMVVTSFTGDGDYREVSFESSYEFQMFVKHEMKRIENTKD